MAHRKQELMAAALDELSKHGIRPSDSGTSGSGHQYVEFMCNGSRTQVFFSATPSRSGPDLVRQKVRRKIRERSGGGLPVPGAATA